MKEVALLFDKAKAKLRQSSYFLHTLFSLPAFYTDKKIVNKAFVNLAEATELLAKSILLYEFKYKRIREYKLDMMLFKKISKNWNLTLEEIKIIENLISFKEKLQESSFNFIKQNKYISFSGKGFSYIEIKDFKNIFKSLKEIYNKIQKKFEKDLLMENYLKNNL